MTNQLRRCFAFLTVCSSLVLVGLSAFSVQDVSASQATPPIGSAASNQVPTDQIIIQYQPSSSQAASAAQSTQMQSLSQAAGVSLQYKRALFGTTHVLRLPARLPLAQVQAIVARLRTLPNVLYAEPDQRMFPVQDSDQFVPSFHPLTLSANDPQFGNQWDFTETWGINMPSAWDITTGSSSIVVADVDTGITHHVEFTGRTVQGYDFVSDAQTANDGDARDSDPSDPGDWVTSAESASGFFANCPVENSSWHGTHTAGTIGANGNNGIGVAGINWNSKILPVRVLGKCGGYLSDIVDGMRWAAGLSVSGVPTNANPAKVINLSLGGSGACDSTTQTAINQITAAGTVVVVAAGNSSSNVSGFTPANCTGVIAVAATNRAGNLAFYSNFGSAVKISAPGGEQSSASDPNGILSTLNTGTQGPVADTYAYYQGTSMATPHVTGVVSLMFSLNPLLTPAQVLQILQSTVKAFPSGGACTTSICGSGILNAAAALNAVPPVISGFAPTSGGIGSSVNITGYNLARATAVKFNGISANFSAVSGTSINATVPAGATTGPISVTVPGGTATSSTNFTVLPPTITGFTPGSGIIGSSVTIAGTNFVGATAVKFNGTSASTFSVDSATSITATVPSGSSTGPISVTSSAGTATSSTNFTVIPPPSITSFSPTSGLIGTSVTITGTSLTGATAVKFNGTSATTFSVDSDTSITVTVPTGATTGAISVTSPTGTGTSSTNFTVYLAPTITSFTPTSGPIGASITITGTNFTGATGVTFFGTNATTFNVVSATSITATVPAGAPTGPITVSTPGGTAISSTSFTVIPAPTISGFTPSSGPIGTSVNITGANFTGATGVTFNGTSATTFSVDSDTSITATVPSGATTGTISVTAPGGTGSSSTNFTVIPAPTLTSFTPTSGPIGATITITGTNFTGATAVKFNGTDASSFNVVSGTSISATVGTGTTTGTISVTTPGGTATSSTNFTVIPAPTIASFAPTSGPVGTNVTITGTNFSGTTAVKFNGTSASTFTVVSATSITATVATGTTTGAISVTTPGGTGTSGTNFTVIPAPMITSFAPTSGPVGATITITGTNFTGATAVKFNGTSATTFSVDSATSITATVPTGVTTGAISVTTPGGTGSSSTNFTVIPVPTITSFTPTSGPIGATITVTGTNFTGATAVKFNGTSASTFTVVSATSITATVATGTTTGAISVTSPGGTGTSGTNFTVIPAPTIASFAPTSGPVGTNVTITGTNFSGTTAVKFNGTSASTFTVVSATSITATVATGTTTGAISVTTPGGTGTSGTNFTVIPAPTITSFAPTSAVAETSVTITGTNFTGASAVKFNGTSASTFNVVSATSITATVPTGATTGAISVTTPGGTATSSTNFSVLVEAPDGLTATAVSESRIDLSWNDNSSTETAFKIEQSPDGSTGWTEIASVAANTSGYENTALDCDTIYYYRVRAYRSGDNTYSPYSNVDSATTSACTLTAPTLLTPANGTLTNNNAPTFTWSDVDHATGYELQLDTGGSFTNPARDMVVSDPSATPTTLLDGTTYFWRVRALADGSQEGPWSTPQTVSIDLARLPAPTLSAPANGANVGVLTPSFTWAAVAGATQYQLQLDDDPAFGSPLFTRGLGRITSYASKAADGLHYGVTYYWRVSAGNAANVFSNYSSARSFTTTIMLTPTNGAYSTTASTLFKWSAVTGATSYTFQAASDSGFAHIEDSSSGMALSHTSPLGAGQHFWRVTVTLAGTPYTMPAWSLVVTPSLPAAPTLIAPVALAQFANPTPTLSWNPVTNPFSYQVQIATTSNFYGPIQDVVLAGTSYTALTLPDGVYYWRVRAINSFNATGAWSQVRLFTIDTTPPPAAKLLTPGNWLDTTTKRPAFKWVAPTGAKTYTLQLFSDSPTCNTLQLSVPNLTAPTYTLSVAQTLLPGNYCWNVLATDALGNGPTPSAMFHFTVSNAIIPGPAAPTLTVPASASSWMPTSLPALTWTGAAGSTFEVQIDTSSAFSNPVRDVVTAVDQLSYAVSPQLTAGTYWWHVRAINAQRVAGAYSAARAFIIQVTPPIAPTLLTPTQNASTTSQHPALKWQAVAGAKTYVLQVASDSTFNTLIVTDRTLTAPTITYTLSSTETLTYGATYFWRVEALDAAGNTSPWSTPFQFIVSVHSSPANGSSTKLIRPTFQWQAVAGATGYELQIASDAGFNTIVASNTGTLTKYTMPISGPALGAGTYYWRVIVTMSSSTLTMPAWTLTVTTTTPGVPVLSTPVNNAMTNDNTPTFVWKAAANAQKYELEVATNNNFASPQLDTITAPGVLSYTSTSLADGKYYWRVRSFDANGGSSAWSAAWVLNIDTQAPVAPVLVGPAPDTTTTNPNLTLRWNAVTGAVSYQVTLDSVNPPQSPPVPVGNVTSYAVTVPHAQGVYYWAVRAIDAAGNVSAWSSVRSFVIAAGMSSQSVKPTPPPFAPPTNTPSAPSPNNAAVQLVTVEAESDAVTRTGNWTTQATDRASGGSYLYSSGQAGDALTLGFTGTQLDLVFVKNPNFGSFAIEIDGTLQQIVDANSETMFGAQVSIQNLGNGPHVVRVYAVQGTIALDTFHVEAVTAPTATPTQAPTATPYPS